jgi:hypothetical protein
MKKFVLFAPLLSITILSAQTRIVLPDNKYSVEQDIQLGREAADQAEDQLPILSDDAVTSYVGSIGGRLVDHIPAELRHKGFDYNFRVINVREINAFALPGGPMFVNRGMIEAAKSEAEVAGVMAHEISHVALRHGTAQASKATKYAIGQMAGQVLGAIIGGNVGSIVAQGTQFGLGTAFLRFSREYEKQADLLGAQIMARAGYDPRAMASMFATIEKQGGSGGPQWLSDHPNPGNRVQYITAEAKMLRVENPVSDTRAFQQVQARLKSMPRAPTTEEATRNARNRQGDTTPRGTSGRSGGVLTGRVDPPSGRWASYAEGGVFRISVPSNWQELQSEGSVTFAPEGGYGEYQGSNVFTHGVQLGVGRNESSDLQTATNRLLDDLEQGNPRMRQAAGSRRTSMGGRSGLATTLSNVSEATGEEETIELVTTQLRDGTLFYYIAVAPAREYGTYRNVFQRVGSSVQFTDR